MENDEDEVEKRKRERREANEARIYHGDGSEIDINGDDLNDTIISKRIDEMFSADNDTDLLSTAWFHG